MNTKIIFAIFGLLALFIISGNRVKARQVNIPGTVTETRVSRFTFLEKLGNPCGFSRGLVIDSRTFAYSYASQAQNSPNDFYQSMVTAINLAIEKVGQLEIADPTLPHCNGLTISSLPATPPFESMRASELFPSVYKAGIFLAAHLHIMSLDRQIVNGNSALRDEQAVEEISQLPYVTSLRCGNESSSLVSIIQELTARVEDILCTLITGATLEERALFRKPYNNLRQATLFRYHSSCSSLEIRDCLVIKESKLILNNMLNKFGKLLVGSDITQIEESDDFQNGLYMGNSL